MTARANGSPTAPAASNLPEIIPPIPPAQLQEIVLTTSTADLVNTLRERPETRGSTVIYIDQKPARAIIPPTELRVPVVARAEQAVRAPREVPATLDGIPAPMLEPNPAPTARGADTAVMPMVEAIAAAPATADDTAVVDPEATVQENFAAAAAPHPVGMPVAEPTRAVQHRETVARNVQMTSTQEFVVGVEFGTHCIRSAIAECFPDSVRVVAYAETPAYGVALGEVVDLQRASETAKRVMRQCAQQANMAIHSAFVGLKGLHLDTQPISAAMALPQGRDTIQPADVRKLQKQLVAAALPTDRQAIEMLPLRYTLEGGLRTIAPAGLKAPSFSAQAQMVTAGSAQLANIAAAIRRVGVYPEQWRLSITAAAQSCLSADERNLGVVVIDIGAGSTAAAWFQHGELRAVRLFSYCGNELTDAIMRKFRLSRQSAEAAKVKYGGASVAQLMAADADEKIPVITADGDGRRQMQRSEMCAVIEEQTDDFLRKICGWLEENSRAGTGEQRLDLSAQAPGGVVLIGGGAMLTGLGDKFGHKMNLPTRIGKPLFLRAAPEIVGSMNQPAACCLHGLLTSAARQRAAEQPTASGSVFSRLWTSLKRFAAEF